MIRLANKNEGKRVLELLNSDPNLWGSEADKATKGDIEQFFSDGIHRVYVYEIDKKIVGLIIARFFKIAKYVYIFYIVVDKDYQKRGIASKLVQHLESIAKKEGYTLIELLTKIKNKKMKKFMRKISYTQGETPFLYYYKELK